MTRALELPVSPIIHRFTIHVDTYSLAMANERSMLASNEPKNAVGTMSKIPFGVKSGVLVSVAEVDSGLSCGCVCPACGRALQARKGHKVAHYFAHNPSDDSSDCETALETAIHLMAKQILSEAKAIFLPKLSIRELQHDFDQKPHRLTEVVTEERGVTFDWIDVERQLDDIRPDLIGYVDGKPLVIEIYVAHKCDREKVRKLRERGLFAIEVDLSKLRYTVTREELVKLLLSGGENKKWLSHPEAPATKRRLRSSLTQKVNSINEEIHRRSSSGHGFRITARKRVQPQRAISARTLTPTKEYPTRIFFCKQCRHQFSMASIEVPSILTKVACTACGAAVSTGRV